jgi:hypothetical protein
MARSIKEVRAATGQALKASSTLVAPQAHGSPLFEPHAKPGPHLPA